MAVQNSLARQSQNRKVGFAAYLTGDAVKAQINKVVGGKNGTRFMTSIISAVNTNPALQECDNASIVSAAPRCPRVLTKNWLRPPVPNAIPAPASVASFFIFSFP